MSDEAKAQGAPKPGPFWNIASLVVPVLGFLILGQHSGMGMGVGELASAVVGGLGGTVGGISCAVAAAVKGERYWGITLLGFLVNVPVLIGAAILAICWSHCK
jgi:hypothetical protein